MDLARTKTYRRRWGPLTALALGWVCAGACTGDNPAFRQPWETHDGVGTGGVGAAGMPGADAAPAPRVDGAAEDLSTGAGVDLGTGLLAFWTFDDESGDTVNDVSGNRHHGRLENLDPQHARVSGGHRGQALEFPAGARNPGVLVTLTPALRNLTAFTVAAWAYRTSAVDNVQNAILSRQLGTGTRQVWDVAFDGDALSAIMSQEEGSNSLRAEATVSAPLNTWLHVAATYDGQALRLYQNGKDVGSSARSWTFPDADNPIYLGTNKNVDNDEAMVGMLDDVALYGVALSPSAIAALFAGALPPVP